ncbi:MAG TPA: hypothetical protein DDW65_08955 [Firmicutes bacterium]|nr:hypothetical protein [Bacillota bacterium]
MIEADKTSNVWKSKITSFKGQGSAAAFFYCHFYPKFRRTQFDRNMRQPILFSFQILHLLF